MRFKPLMTSVALGCCLITSPASLDATPSSSQFLVGGIADTNAGDISGKLVEAGFAFICLEPFVDSADELAQLTRDRAFRYIYYTERTSDTYHIILIKGSGKPKYIAVRQFNISDPDGKIRNAECISLSRVSIAMKIAKPKLARINSIEPVQLVMRVNS